MRVDAGRESGHVAKLHGNTVIQTVYRLVYLECTVPRSQVSTVYRLQSTVSYRVYRHDRPQHTVDATTDSCRLSLSYSTARYCSYSTRPVPLRCARTVQYRVESYYGVYSSYTNPHLTTAVTIYSCTDIIYYLRITYSTQ